MKRQRAPIEVFNLAFLDIISCAFGAVVMLILLAKNGDEGVFNDTSQISSLIQALTRAESSVEDLKGAVSDRKQALQTAQASAASHASEKEALEAAIARAKNNIQKLTDAASGLEQVKVERQRAALSRGNAKDRDKEVGGIPVDSEYVIFVIDTSGSMQDIWGKVLSTMKEVLNNHPQVKGFQVMSDNGEYLLKSTKGRWRKDTKAQRAAVLRAMKSWSGWSSSSPVEGIEEALKTYAKRTPSLALYILGDDYTGGSYDKTVAQINDLNTNKQGKAIARIHGIGFRNGIGGSVKFATLMREVSRQNRGSFIAY